MNTALKKLNIQLQSPENSLLSRPASSDRSPLPNTDIDFSIDEKKIVGAEATTAPFELPMPNNNNVIDDDWDWGSLQWLPSLVFLAFREQQERRDKEEAIKQLQQVEGKYSALAEQIPGILYIASLQSPGRLLYLSPKISILGFPYEEYLNADKGLFSHIHSEDQSSVIEAYEYACEHQAQLRCEYRLIRSDGQVRWFLDEANVVRNDAGEALFLQGILVDITKDKEIEQELFYYRRRLEALVTQRTLQLEKQCTILHAANANLDKALSEQKHAESALRTSETRFRQLLESVGEGIIGLDEVGDCTFVNEAALDMLGYSQDELLGQNAHTILHHTYTDSLPTPMDRWTGSNSFQTIAPYRSAELFRCKDGSFIPVECSSYPMQNDGRSIGLVMVCRDVTESLCYQATHDPLTGLVNRMEFDKRAVKVLASAQENQSENVLCFLDLDQFKMINDTCGHSAGDELLKALTALIKSKLRQRDTLARLGGDEFVLLLEHCSLEQALIIGNDLCESVKNFEFKWNDNIFSVSVSIGLATLTSADKDIKVVLAAADTACYLAKKNGRNQVYIFKSECL